MTSIRLTEEDCRGLSWEVVEVTPHYRRSIGRGHHPVTGVEITAQRTEYLAEDSLLEANQAARNEHDGVLWSAGMGSDKGGNVPLVHVASVPLNKFFADMAPKLREGDDDHAKWWLRRDENQPFRTRRGGV